MPAYYGTWRVISAQPVPPQLMALARKLVGGMIEQGDIPQKQWRLDDGSTIHALLVNGVPKVTITQASSSAGQEDSPYNLWIPRGFVVYPAWIDAPGGVGLPIVQDSTSGPLDPTNLAPGLLRSHWTASGPCGEVLISPDKEAGYPSSPLAIITPLLFHPTLGPTFQWDGQTTFDARPTDGAWASYRMELAAPVAHYTDESAADAEAMLLAINTYRASYTLTALNLPPRGYYGAAEVMASIMQANGSTAETAAGYPDTYTTAADRLTKDGYTATVMAVPFVSFTRGDNPMAWEVRGLGGQAGVLAAWQADTTSDAALLVDVGNAAFGDVGFRGGYWAANVIRRSSWIAAGNASWQSADTNLPPVSWHSFASINLAWETYPATYDPTNYTTAPLVPLRSFTNTQGDCWLNYHRNTGTTSADLEPALSRHIYLRGRAIALAPRGGLVWAACIVPITTSTGTADRLVALIHQPDDQPTDYTHEGFTRYLSVWWADIPRRSQLYADPQQTIAGVDPADPWAWRGGQQIDLGTMPAPNVGFTASAGINSLKYASCWRFSPDGSRAICLRDYGAYLDYGVLQDTGVGGSWSASLNARAVELVFTHDPASTVATVAWHDYTAGITAPDRLIDNATPPDTADVFNVAMYEQGAYALAVDYDAGGAVIYAYSATVSSHQYLSYNPTDGDQGWVSRAFYAYVGIGGDGVRYPTELGGRILHGARFQTSSVDAYHEMALVLDVNRAAFALKVSRPRFYVVPGNALASIARIARPCATFTTDVVDGVTLCRDGTVLGTDWYSSPDGAIFTTNDPCYLNLTDVNGVRVDLPLAVSGMVQGFHAERFGESIFGYQVAPTPGATWMLGSAPSGTPCGCVVDSTELAAATLMTSAQFNPRGGRVISSVPLPDHSWLIYGKVV